MKVLHKQLIFFTILLLLSSIPAVILGQNQLSNCDADVDGNGIVEIDDLEELRSSFFGRNITNSKADVNNDEIVDIIDVITIVRFFGQTCADTSNDHDNDSSTDQNPGQSSINLNNPRPEVMNLFCGGSWNIPAREIGFDESKNYLVTRMYNDGTAARPGNFNINYDWYTYPVFIADTNTPRRTVNSANPGWSNIDGATIPYDPSWRPTAGSDAQIIIIDPTTDTYYDLWQVTNPTATNQPLNVSNGTVVRNYSQKLDGEVLPSRGIGIAYLAMLVTPEEVARGSINHALSLTGVPITSPEYVAPAIKSDGQNSNGIAEGTRFALTMNDAEIEAWVKTKPNNLQRLARALAYAMRDYGYVVSDSGGGAAIQLEDLESSPERWAELGVTSGDSLRDLLDGLDWLEAKVVKPKDNSNSQDYCQEYGDLVANIPPTASNPPTSQPDPEPDPEPVPDIPTDVQPPSSDIDLTDPRPEVMNLFCGGSWYIPAQEIGFDNSRQNYVDNLYYYGTAGTGNTNRNLNLGYDQYTYPVYIATSNTPKRVVQTAGPSYNTAHGVSAPFDPSWRPSAGSDGQVIVIDPINRHYYDFWQVANPGQTSSPLRVTHGSKINYDQNQSGENLVSRGVGLAYLAMLVSPEEVAKGKINHALSLSGVKNTSPQFVPPAIKSDGRTNSNSIPEGTRFALTMTNSEIESWVQTKPTNLQRLARTLVYAMRDYGYIVSDTGGGAFIQLEDFNTAGSRWAELGVRESGSSLRDLLDDLPIRESRVVRPKASSSTQDYCQMY